MRIVFGILLFFAFFGCSAQQSQVVLQFDQTSVLQGDSLRFTIECTGSHALEVYVMKSDSLLFSENEHVSDGVLSFAIGTAHFPLGNYFILVTGNNVHLERQFALWREE